MSKKLQQLLMQVKKYNPDTDTTLIRDAYKYITSVYPETWVTVGNKSMPDHALDLLEILVMYHMDDATIVATILHDVLRFTAITPRELRKHFPNEVVRMLVEFKKVSALGGKGIEGSTSPALLLKALLSMVSDTRVLLLLVANRLNYLRQNQKLSHSIISQKAETTLSVYTVIASIINAWEIKSELEDLAFKILHPEEYKALSKRISDYDKQHNTTLTKVRRRLLRMLSEQDIKAEIYFRTKRLYSIYRKLQKKKKDELLDIYGIRIVVTNVEECYRSLGLVHQLLTPVPKRFKDYIGNPKKNNYRSLHTTVVADEVTILEVQIRTKEMDEFAEYGEASHLSYKSQLKRGKIHETFMEELLQVSKKIVEEENLAQEVQLGFLKDQIYLLYQESELLEVPNNSTLLDILFSRESEKAMYSKEVRVNGTVKTLDYEPKSGDIVTVLFSKEIQIKKDWMTCTLIHKNKMLIQRYLETLKRNKTEVKGEEKIHMILRTFGIKSIKHIQSELDNYLSEHKISLNDFLKNVSKDRKPLEEFILSCDRFQHYIQQYTSLFFHEGEKQWYLTKLYFHTESQDDFSPILEYLVESKMDLKSLTQIEKKDTIAVEAKLAFQSINGLLSHIIEIFDKYPKITITFA